MPNVVHPAYPASPPLTVSTAALQSWLDNGWILLPDGTQPSGGTSTGPVLTAWTANTAYRQNQLVVNPSGVLVRANSSFVSGATYTAANWTATGDGVGAGGTVDKAVVINTGVKATDLGGLDKTTADGAYALGVVTVKPSGDTTGATDGPAINAALAAVGAAGGGRVQLGNLNAPTTYYGSVALTVPSNVTLLLSECTYRLVNGSTANLVKNADQSVNGTGNANIRVIGHGRAVFDGNGVNQVRVGYGLGNVGLYFVHVDTLRVENVTILNTSLFGALMQGVTNAHWQTIRVSQDRSVVNQDGIDIGPGCTNITIDGVSGVTGDDGFSIYAKNTGGGISPWAAAQTAAARSISGITIRNVDLDVGINPFRLQAGDGSTLKRLRFSNVTNRRLDSRAVNADTTAVLMMGPTNYVTTAPQPGDLADITLDGYTGTFTNLIGAESVFSNVAVRNVTVVADDGSALRSWDALIGDQQHQSGFAPTCSNVTVENVHINRAVGGSLVKLLTGSVAAGITVRNVHALGLLAVNASSCGISGLELDGIHIGTALGKLFTQTVASTGVLGRVQVDAYASGVTTVLDGAALGLRIAGPIPTLTNGDVTPTAVVGSQILCDATKDPSSSGFTTPGLYVGSGLSWVRLANLPGDVTPPATPSAPTATAAASTIGVTWPATTDNVGVARYRLYRSDNPNTVLATVTSGTSYTDTTPLGGTAYTYTVDAQDTAGNTSAKSAASNSVTISGSNGFVSDTFTDTDGVTLIAHTGQVGATWTKAQTTTGNAVMIGNRVRSASTNAMPHLASGTPASADYLVEADIYFASLLAGSSLGVWGRGSGNSSSTWNGYVLRYVVNSTAWQLVKYVNGATTTIASFTATPGAGETHHVKLTMTGSQIVGSIDGTVPAGFSVTDTTTTAAGQAGLYFTSSTAPSDTTGLHADNFRAA